MLYICDYFITQIIVVAHIETIANSKTIWVYVHMCILASRSRHYMCTIVNVQLLPGVKLIHEQLHNVLVQKYVANEHLYTFIGLYLCWHIDA